MISAKAVFLISLLFIFLAVAGAALMFFGFNLGRYICYIAIPLGGITIAVGSFVAQTGNVKDDIHEK